MAKTYDDMAQHTLEYGNTKPLAQFEDRKKSKVWEEWIFAYSH